MLYWLLSAEALQVRTLRAIREARTPLTAELPRARAERESPLSYDGRTAVIRVEGVLTPSPDMMAECYGEPNTTYPDLQAALAEARENKVREVLWKINSPGGAVDGLFELLGDIAEARAAGVKMRVEASSAHSAAYGIAAAVGEITATSRTAAFGSVGVATSGFVSGGICGKVVDITSSNAPEKRPDLETPEGRAVVVAYLDQIEEEFFGAIAAGRGISSARVAEGYGRGASMLAPKAESAGLIDKIAKRKRRAYGSAAAYAPNLTDARSSDTVPERMLEDPTTSDDASDANLNAPEGPEPEVVVSAPVTVEALPVAVDASAVTLAAAERAELASLRADRDARETAERRSLITELVALGSERPATAWVNNAPAPHLAAMDLPALRARVELFRASSPKTPDIRPPAQALAEFAELSDTERETAEKITDAAHRARFIDLCKKMRVKAQGKV